MWLSWRWAAVLAVALGVAGRLWRRRSRSSAPELAVEASLVAGLYAVWQLIGTFTDRAVTGASGHALWLWHLERRLHLPSELTMQRAVIGHPLVVQAANVFYAVVHVPALGVFLFWLWFRHRDRYPFYRNALAVLTFACFLVHLVPVAPPRLLPGVGFVDTAALYHQSVYGPMGTGISDQLSAMPSLHMAWAALIGWAVVRVSTSRWRWLVLAHPALTMLVVVVTGNHVWLDGVAAAVLLAVSLGAAAVIDRVGVRRPEVAFAHAESG